MVSNLLIRNCIRYEEQGNKATPWSGTDSLLVFTAWWQQQFVGFVFSLTKVARPQKKPVQPQWLNRLKRREEMKNCQLYCMKHATNKNMLQSSSSPLQIKEL